MLRRLSSLSNVLVFAFLGALLVPFVVVTILLLQLDFAQHSEQAETKEKLLVEQFSHAIDRELHRYENLMQLFCKSGRLESAPDVTSVPLVICGQVGEGNQPLLAFDGPVGYAYLSDASIRSAPWWGDAVKLDMGSKVHFDATFGIPAPFYRKFVVLISRDNRTHQTHFAVFDPVQLHSALDLIHRTLDHPQGLIPILESEKKKLFYAPEWMRAADIISSSPSESGSQTLNHSDRTYDRIEVGILKQGFARGNLNYRLYRDRDEIGPNLTKTVVLVIFCLGFVFVLGWGGMQYIHRLIHAPVSQLSVELRQYIEALQRDDKDTPDVSFKTQASIDEILNLEKGLNELVDALRDRETRLKSLNDTLAETQSLAKLGEMSAQVAHDIRSPLAALESVVGISNAPEAERVLLRSASNRIKDIANDLVAKSGKMKETYRKMKGEPEENETESRLESHLLLNQVELILSEMRVQYGESGKIAIESIYGSDSYGLFARFDASEFARVLSNLLSNSIDAIDEVGSITVFLTRQNKNAVLTIRDSGCGIPSEEIQDVLRRGVSKRKKNGSGLGLWYANERVMSWGGQLSIRSRVGEGTSVIIELPLCENPSWFLPKLEIENGSRVVILDDDPSIHQVWEERLAAAGVRDVEYLHFHYAKEADLYLDSLSGEQFDSLFCLFDYELMGSDSTGLDVFERHSGLKKVALVTSHFQDEAIRERCESLGIGMIPKNLAAVLPIVAVTREEVTLRALRREGEKPDSLQHRPYT